VTRDFRTGFPVLMLVAIAGVDAYAATGGFTFAQAEEAYRSAFDGVDLDFESPRQRHIAWIDGGDLIIAHAPGFVPEILVSRSDGAVTQATLANDGRSVIYVRERRNPAIRELLRLDTERGGVATVIVAGDIPAIRAVAPGGNALAYTNNGLYEYRMNAAGQWKSRLLIGPEDARHTGATGIRDPVYSPDGMRIAFVSRRKAQQSYMVVYDVETGESRYFDPGIFQDQSPMWSPDGTEIGFVREPGNWTMRYRFTPQKAPRGASWPGT
jgi:hypothetical protein